MDIDLNDPLHRRFVAESAVTVRVYTANRVRELLKDQPNLTSAKLLEVLEEDVRRAREEFDARDDAND